MMPKRILYVFLMLLLAWLLAACGSSPPSHFYTLDSTAQPQGSPSADYAVAIQPVSIPAVDDRPQFVVQTGPNQVAVDEFNRWAAPLDESIARVVAGDLSTLLGTPRVVLAPPTNVNPAYRVTIQIQRFDAYPGKSVLVDAVWMVRDSTGGVIQSGRTLTREAVQDPGFDGLAAGYSRALATLSGDIAAAIRKQAQAK